MRKPKSKPPANDARPVRRSLVELTAAASYAASDDAPVMPIFPIAANIPPEENVANGAVPAPEPRRARAAESTASPGGVAEMLADIAKDHQARVLDSIRLSLAAAQDYAKDLARTPVPSDPQDGRAKPDDNLLAAVRAAAGYRAEALELVKANLTTTLDYARGIAEATTAAEFIELSSELARKQCEFTLKQAAALQSFGQVATKSRDR